MSARPPIARLRRSIADVAARLPAETVLDVATRAGHWWHRLRANRPSPRELAALFDGLPVARADYDRVAREIAGFEFRKAALRALVTRGGIEVASSLLVPHGLDAFEQFRRPSGPVVVMTCHFGAPNAMGAAFTKLQLPVLAIRHEDSRAATAGSVVAVTEGDASRQTSALWQAVRWLRDGGVVIVAADGSDGQRSAPVPCLGRSAVFGRGAFAMTRLGGATAVPVVGLWTPDGRIAMHVGAPLVFDAGGTGAECEINIATAFAAWYERLALAHPEQMRANALRLFLGAPRLASR